VPVDPSDGSSRHASSAGLGATANRHRPRRGGRAGRDPDQPPPLPRRRWLCSTIASVLLFPKWSCLRLGDDATNPLPSPCGCWKKVKHRLAWPGIRTPPSDFRKVGIALHRVAFSRSLCGIVSLQCVGPDCDSRADSRGWATPSFLYPIKNGGTSAARRATTRGGKAGSGKHSGGQRLEMTTTSDSAKIKIGPKSWP